MMNHRLNAILGSALAMMTLVSACSPAPPSSPTAVPSKPTDAIKQAAPANPAPVTSAPAAKPAASSGWEQVVDAAKSEKVVLVTSLGDNDKAMVAAFKKAYPDVPIEHTGARPSDISPRIITEQQQGLFDWDLMYSNGTSNMHEVLLPANAFQDTPPFLMLPDVLDDSKWGAGKTGLFTSTTKPQILIHEIIRSNTLYVNRDKIPASELNDISQLTDPKFKGKFVIDDCRVAAGGTSTLVGLYQARGEPFVKSLLSDQQPAFQETKRITAEWVTSGKYPIGVGLDEQELNKMQQEGIGKNVVQLDYEGGNITSSGIAVFRNAPHPNATKVFLNWFLSKEGQTTWTDAWSTPVPRNSRRLDVPIKNKEGYPDYAHLEKYAIWGTDSGSAVVKAVTSACKDAYTG